MTEQSTRRAWVILHLENGIHARHFGVYSEPTPTSRMRELQCPIAHADGATYAEARARAIFAAAWRIAHLGASIRHVFQTSGNKLYPDALHAVQVARESVGELDRIREEFVAKHSKEGCRVGALLRNERRGQRWEEDPARWENALVLPLRAVAYGSGVVRAAHPVHRAERRGPVQSALILAGAQTSPRRSPIYAYSEEAGLIPIIPGHIRVPWSGSPYLLGWCDRDRRREAEYRNGREEG